MRDGREQAAREAFVIGVGEVGRRLSAALERAGWSVHGVTRERGWPAALDSRDASPRIVAVREEDLGAVLSRFPDRLRERLVLVQNGFLEAVHGDLGDVARGLIYFTSKKEFFRVLCPSPLWGRAAEPLADPLDSGGIPVEIEPDRQSFLAAMIVKGVWNAVVGLPLAVHGVDLAGYRTRQRDELEALVEESTRAAGAEYGVEVPATTALEKILETTSELGWVRGGAKALPWRNGALAWFGRRHGVPTPVNDRLLAAVGYDPSSVPATAALR